ncbi:holo-ACP synthase [Chlamydia pecorum]|uniref:Holo-[acyl-carrier-protein] synthase n=2 Tax=Chlamydia pecorum TaxID=85991 RepID=A0AA34RDM3_CHLPE|nr:holo-ACP synthase [Chlamydia pecorum]AEB41766.1 holo-(acyl-carrier-protein) synthase [Chlamydia pecorum E58]AGW37950.1 holo-(acyl-carrier-protein) synthase [Chlamydia pecorum PV3056/3]AGW38871.1 holo-(acyl-carrier-protein) synthase [Chlamydia pecorum W73]AGW39796.1 holo-(acyl-carrier-protein) synthase [Chlamydia pecorum P787]ETF37523.1 holo-ACP synthase [Chlamydia pecorum VR629]
MEIIHIGTDIIEIQRIRKAIEKHGKHILNRLFTIKEQEYCLKKAHPFASFAARFAGKEAVAKALGTGIGKIVKWKDIEILKTSSQPEVFLAPHIPASTGINKVILSISHSQNYATATAIALA